MVIGNISKKLVVTKKSVSKTKGEEAVALEGVTEDPKKKEGAVEKILAPSLIHKKKTISSQKQVIAKTKKKTYYEAVGRRKTSVARIRLETTNPSESAESGNFIINDKKHTEYFSIPELIQICEAALRKIKSLNRFMVSVRVRGGGITSQAEAIRHGIARALVRFDANFRKKLKKSGYLTRDPRMRERKKYGLKRARRAPQWVKR